jgi:hypothetical protein
VLELDRYPMLESLVVSRFGGMRPKAVAERELLSVSLRADRYEVEMVLWVGRSLQNQCISSARYGAYM